MTPEVSNKPVVKYNKVRYGVMYNGTWQVV